MEENYEFIRYVLTKGSSFDELTQEKTNLLMSHINSTSRDSLNGKTPYDAVLLVLAEENINKLGVTKIVNWLETEEGQEVIKNIK